MKTEQVNLKADTWREEGPWLLLLIAPFVALAFRRGWLGDGVLRGIANPSNQSCPELG
jgi:Ca-activated chloride channel family protein